MAHFQQLQFVHEVSEGLPEFFFNKKVLEIGSWDVNGTIRGFFKDCDYLGVDIAEGQGVDLVCKGEDIDIADQTFDVVISCECFEHNIEWVRTFNNMVRMLKPGGLCLITCATLGRPEHGTKRTMAGLSLTAINNFSNYYRNLSPADFRKNINLDNHFSSYKFFINMYSKDLYFVGIKKGNSSHPFVFDKEMVRRIENIRRNKPTSFLSNFVCKAKFLFKFALASLLGEQKYHDLRFRMRKAEPEVTS